MYATRDILFLPYLVFSETTLLDLYICHIYLYSILIQIRCYFNQEHVKLFLFNCEVKSFDILLRFFSIAYRKTIIHILQHFSGKYCPWTNFLEKHIKDYPWLTLRFVHEIGFQSGSCFVSWTFVRNTNSFTSSMFNELLCNHSVRYSEIWPQELKNWL